MCACQTEVRAPGRLVGALVGGVASLVLLTGVASAERGYTTWYGPGFHGRVMASGQTFDENDPTTTASNEFPFGTWLRVTNPGNGRTVYVQVRDRGAFTHALDLSRAAYFQLEPPNPWGFWVDYEVVPGPGEEPRAAAVQPTSRGAEAAPPRLVPKAAGPRLIAVKATAAAPAAAASPPAASPKPAAEHIVGVGDTLFKIGQRYGLPLRSLIEWNQLERPDSLSIGQTLRLSAPGRRYLVQRGDTLNSVAERLGVSRAALLEQNQIDDPNALAVGQVLVVPG
jgi:rare lipoprotein A